MQIDHGVGVPRAVRGLVEAHGPAAGPLPRLADQPGGLPDVVLGDAGDLGDGGGREAGEEGGHLLPAVGVAGDEVGVRVPVLVQQVQQPVQQGQIGARLDLQEQVGLGRGGGAARVDDDQLGAGRLHPVHHAQEEDGVAVGHVGADDEEEIGAVEVLIRPRRPVGAERQLVSGARAGHAQPRVRLDLVRPDEPLGQFVRQILGLQAHLPGDVEGDGVRPVLVDDGPQPPGRLPDGRPDGVRYVLLAPLVPYQGGGQPSGSGEHVGGGRTLGAQPAEVGRVVLVAGRLQDRTASVRSEPDIQHDAAAHTAVRADRPHLRRLHRAGVPRVRRGHGHPCLS